MIKIDDFFMSKYLSCLLVQNQFLLSLSQITLNVYKCYLQHIQTKFKLNFKILTGVKFNRLKICLYNIKVYNFFYNVFVLF